MERRGFFAAVAAACASPVATVLLSAEPPLLERPTAQYRMPRCLIPTCYDGIFHDCTFNTDGVYVPADKMPTFHNCTFYQSNRGHDTGQAALAFDAIEAEGE